MTYQNPELTKMDDVLQLLATLTWLHCTTNENLQQAGIHASRVLIWSVSLGSEWHRLALTGLHIHLGTVSSACLLSLTVSQVTELASGSLTDGDVCVGVYACIWVRKTGHYFG